MTGRWRSTIRVRLTLLYAGAFFLAGAILITVMYAFHSHSLEQQMATHVGLVEQLRTHAPPGLADRLQSQLEAERNHTLRAMLIASLASLGVVGVAAGAFGWLLAGRALRPLQQITATARRVADRSLHERIALEAPDDEIKELADTFDAMLERLDRSFDSQRRFVANASHELRTPLTINRTLVEVALDNPQVSESLRQLGASLLAVNQRHERIIDGLLTLASSEERLTTRRPVDLADIARHTANERQTGAGQAGVEIRTELAPAPVAGDPVLLERLVQNLVDNAVRYNIADHGWVAVTTCLEHGDAVLTVENTGPTVPPYDIPSLFEPFRRLADTERRATPGRDHGSGLGLSIVRSVTRAHGGAVSATPRPDGGLVVRVRMPELTDDQMPESGE
jgi:signal transduction histidine kinase